MADQARTVSLMFRPGQLPSGSDNGFADTLARHLVGRRLRTGQRLALPGWPRMTVADVDPPEGEVGPRTEIEISVPPGLGDGPMHIAILVDASLTMGEGRSPTAYDRAASLIEAFLLNGRSFLASAGIVVQGGETRHIEPLTSLDTLSGAVIHRVEPKGIFDLEAGLEASLDVLEKAGEGPRAVLLVTDGDLGLLNPLNPALSVARSGTRLYAVAEDLSNSLAEACRHTGGVASQEAETVFEAIADVVGARGSWRPPESPDNQEDEGAFETVIESVETEGPP